MPSAGQIPDLCCLNPVPVGFVARPERQVAQLGGYEWLSGEVPWDGGRGASHGQY